MNQCLLYPFIYLTKHCIFPFSSDESEPIFCTVAARRLRLPTVQRAEEAVCEVRRCHREGHRRRSAAYRRDRKFGDRHRWGRSSARVRPAVACSFLFRTFFFFLLCSRSSADCCCTLSHKTFRVIYIHKREEGNTQYLRLMACLIFMHCWWLYSRSI
jgi:hypothetical protein